MALLDQLQSDVKDAMRARDTERVTALRMFVNALQNEAKDKLRPLEEQEEVAVLSRERKKRVEAAEAYEQAGAADRAQAERAQQQLLERYLPSQLTDAELQQIVNDAVAESGATSQQQMGQVMKLVMPKVQGRADGNHVSAAVRAALANDGGD